MFISGCSFWVRCRTFWMVCVCVCVYLTSQSRTEYRVKLVWIQSFPSILFVWQRLKKLVFILFNQSWGRTDEFILISVKWNANELVNNLNFSYWYDNTHYMLRALIYDMHIYEYVYIYNVYVQYSIALCSQ